LVSFPPSPQPDLEANKESANAGLTLPLMRSLREQSPQSLFAHFARLQWFVRHDLHKCDAA
jgi:hypothetical protein